MIRILVFIFALSHFETIQANPLVAPPSASMEFEEARPAPKMKPTSLTPVNPTAPPGTAAPPPMGTQQPAGVPAQQALPAQNVSGQPVMVPVQSVPNVSNGQDQQQAMTLIQQFMQMFGGGGQAPGSPPMYLPNGQINPAWQESVRGRPNDPYYGRNGTPTYNRNFPGLQQAPMMTAEEAARRLKGHRCNPNDKDRLACMVCNLMYEAGNESREGQMAVARSVMTRAFSTKYPDTVCKVVYQNNGRVAQYSWTFEDKDHTLPHSSKVDDLIKVAMEALRKGPNGLTNYYAWRLVNPPWGSTGECARTSTRIGNHQFCTINGEASRSVSSYLAAEGIHSTNGTLSGAVPGTSR